MLKDGKDFIEKAHGEFDRAYGTSLKIEGIIMMPRHPDAEGPAEGSETTFVIG